MMKRILSFVLILMFLFASVSFEISVKADDTSYSKEQADLLCALGILDYTELTDAYVTRAQFVRYTMKLAGIPVSTYTGAMFDDVPQAHVDYDYIMSAVDFGLISVAEKFRPDDIITPTEAIKIVVHLLGYDFMAYAKGGYPTGYLQTAQSIDLLKGIDISVSGITEYGVCNLLYNALKVKLPEVSYTTNGAQDYYIGTATLLEKYRGIIEVSGIVDGVSYYSDYKTQGLGDDRLSINGTIYNVGNINCDGLYGYDVVAYYDIENKIIVSCTPTDNNRVIKIYAEDIVSFTNGVFTYQVNDLKTQNVSVTPESTVFYNGRLFKYDDSKLIPESGSLTFVSPNGSGAFSTLYINSYKTIVVSKTSQGDEYIVLDKYSKDNTIVFDPDDTEYIVADHNGDELDFSSILPGDVVNAAVSDDGKYVELICVKDEFMGTYSGYGTDFIEVDGSKYYLSASIKNKVSEIIPLGKQGVFRLDIDKRIADIIPAQGVGESLGYLAVGKVHEQGLSNNLAVRILSTDGKIYNYYFSNTFSINGKTYKDFNKAYNDHKSPDYDSLRCGVIKYSINDEGKIKSIIYPDNEGGIGGLYYTNSISKSSGSKFSQWYLNIDHTIVGTTDMIIFKVPDPIHSVNSSDDELYSVESASIIYGEGSTNGYKLVGYTTVPDDGVTTHLLMQRVGSSFDADALSIPNKNPPYMVNSVRKVVIDGETIEKLELCNHDYKPSSPLTVYSKGENDFTQADISAGDIVRVLTNEKNVVRSFELIWKKGSKTFTDNSTEINSGSGRNNEKIIKFAYAYSIRGTVLDAVSIDKNVNSVSEADMVALYMPHMKVMKFDNRSKSVIELSVNDIKDYKNFGDMKNTFIYNTNYEAHGTVFMVD